MSETNYETEDCKEFINIIRRIVREEIASNRGDEHKTVVAKINSTTSILEYFLSSDLSTPISVPKNPHGLTISDGDKVQLLCKNGNINNSWITIKQ